MSISLKKVNKNNGYAIDQGFPNFLKKPSTTITFAQCIYDMFV